MNKEDGIRDYKDVEVLEHSLAYQGYFRIEQYKLRFRKFAGDWSRIIVREIFERGDAVAVLLYDPKLEKVVLLEQFRIGAVRELANQGSPWLIELVAGVMEENEKVEDVALREIKEETGIAIDNKAKLIPICEYYVSPGGSTEKISLFCVCIDASQAGGIHGLPEEAEDIRVNVMDFDLAYAYVREGKINNSQAIIALQWLQINKHNKHLFV